MWPLFALYFVVGCVIGSFLNVCIYRMPNDQSIISPPSHCGACGHRLAFLDMIPIFSYVFLGGKCRYCHTAYSCRYALVELLTGILFTLCGMHYLPSIPLVLVFVFVASLVTITFVDFDHQIILDEFLILMAAAGVLYVALYTHDWKDAGLGLAVAGGFMLILYYGSRGGMGEGDVKLSFVLGWWLGLSGSLVCLLLAFVLGGLVGVSLLLSGKKTRKDAIPFGPYLCIGAYVALLYGPYLVYYYWSFFL